MQTTDFVESRRSNYYLVRANEGRNVSAMGRMKDTGLSHRSQPHSKSPGLVNKSSYTFGRVDCDG